MNRTEGRRQEEWNARKKLRIRKGERENLKERIYRGKKRERGLRIKNEGRGNEEKKERKFDVIKML